MSYDPSPLIRALHRGIEADAAARTAFNRFYGLEFDGCDDRLYSLPLGDFRIALHAFVPPRACGRLLLVHGYHDHHGLYGHLIRYGLRRRLAVLCFDLPGHGLSSGPQASIDEFAHYQPVLEGVLNHLDTLGWPGPLHLLGQSTGAAILSDHLLSRRPAVDGGIVLLAPLVRPARWRLVEAAHRLLGGWLGETPRQFNANSHDPAFLRFVRERDPLQGRAIAVPWVGALRRWIPHFLALPPAPYPVLIVQGREDRTVDWPYNLGILRQKFPNAAVYYLSEGRHHLANEAAAIRAQYLAWLDQRWSTA